MKLRMKDGRQWSKGMKLPIAIKRIMGLLDKTPDGEIWTRIDLEAELDYSRCYLSSFTSHPVLQDYVISQRNKVSLYANKKTIAYLRDHPEELPQ